MTRYPQGILVSCEVPWDENEQLIEPVFRQEVAETLRAGFRHVYIFGTAGEGYAVTLTQFEQIARIFWEETRSEGVLPMVGVIAMSTGAAIERITIAYKIGFRTFQLALPNWHSVNDAELARFFQDVCGAFVDCSFLHYNLPRSGRVLNGADYERLVRLVPNLVATKNTSGDLARTADLMRKAPELQHFFGERNFALGCLFGECSLLGGHARLGETFTQDLYELGRTGKIEAALRMASEINEVGSEVLGWLDGPRVDGAYDKLVVNLGGTVDMPLRLLSPYQGFSENELAQCRQILADRFPDWVKRSSVTSVATARNLDLQEEWQ